MPQTVLVADDSPTIQKKASGILTGEGLEVVTVSNGVAAIKKLPVVKPVVVLADVSMPGKDGYEVCAFVKNSPELRHVPVILIVSDMEPYDEERGARVRADGKISKRTAGMPFDPEELISMVRKFLVQSVAAAPGPAAGAAAPPEPTVVTEPVDEEPQVASRERLDISSLSEAFAFAEPATEEIAAPPLGAVAEPMVEAELPVPPALEPEVVAAPEAVVETPAAEPAEMVAAPEELGIPAVEEAPIPVEPVLIEEPVAEAPDLQPAPFPAAERTLIFRQPIEIAEPVLSDELAPAPPVAEPAPEETAVIAETVPEAEVPPAEAVAIEPEAALVAPPAEVSLAATSLEGFSLTEAAAGQVGFAPPEGEVAPAPEAVATTPSEPEAVVAPLEAGVVEGVTPALPTTFDANLLYSIVRKVVCRMAPPVLPPQTIEEVTQRLTDEILAELNSESSQVQ